MLGSAFCLLGGGGGSLYFMVLSVCVFAGEEIIRFEVAKKKFVSFNGEKRKKLAMGSLFLCLDCQEENCMLKAKRKEIGDAVF